MTKTRRGFLVWPDDSINELEDDGHTARAATVRGIHASLVANGLPLNGGDDDHWSRVLDFSIDDNGAVTAYTTGQAPHEHSIPREAIQPVIDWLTSEGAL